jgi:FkbM family methyltransferase
MLTRILGESQRRTALTRTLEKILHPLNRLILKISLLRKIEFCMYVGEFYFFFRPFIFSDLIMLFTDYEPYTKRVFQPRKGETVIDVGAHFGMYTLNAAKKVGEDGIVISFEPDERNFNLLKKNVRLNGFRGVKLYNKALDRSNGKKTLFLTVDPLFSSLLPSTETRGKIAIETLTLDSVIQDLKLTQIDWVKIDVEGNELSVLEGGINTFTNLVNRIIIETSNPDVIRFLLKRGFKIQRLHSINYFASKIQVDKP